jgi:hypothetical protein
MMTKLASRIRTALFCGFLGVSTLAGATASSTNFSDMWWNPAESGWGININQQSDILFATLFVYSLDGKAHWYISTLTSQSAAADGSPIFAGDLYETTGPFFGVAFNPALVTINAVGTATFQGNGSTRAALQYTVNGVPVSKQIQRQTLRNNDIAGRYLGGTSDITYDCTPASRNNIVTEDGGGITITQNADLVTIKTPTCTFNGTYAQNGQVGRIDASYGCNTGAIGALTFTDIYVETSGIIGRYTGHDDTCSFTGTIGGARRQ